MWILHVEQVVVVGNDGYRVLDPQAGDIAATLPGQV